MTNNLSPSIRQPRSAYNDLANVTPNPNESILGWIARTRQLTGYGPTLMDFRINWCHIQLSDPMQRGSDEVQNYIETHDTVFRWGGWLMFESEDDAIMLFLINSDHSVLYHPLKDTL